MLIVNIVLVQVIIVPMQQQTGVRATMAVAALTMINVATTVLATIAVMKVVTSTTMAVVGVRGLQIGSTESVGVWPRTT